MDNRNINTFPTQDSLRFVLQMVLKTSTLSVCLRLLSLFTPHLRLDGHTQRVMQPFCRRKVVKKLRIREEDIKYDEERRKRLQALDRRKVYFNMRYKDVIIEIIRSVILSFRSSLHQWITVNAVTVILIRSWKFSSNQLLYCHFLVPLARASTFLFYGLQESAHTNC